MSVKIAIFVAPPYPIKSMPNLRARRFETFKNVFPSTCPPKTVANSMSNESEKLTLRLGDILTRLFKEEMLSPLQLEEDYQVSEKTMRRDFNEKGFPSHHDKHGTMGSLRFTRK